MSRFVYGNIGRHRPRAQLEAPRKVKRQGGRWAVYGFGEVGEADGRVDEPAELRRVFRGWKVKAVRTKHPIALNPLIWKIEDVEVTLAARGEPGLWPHRYIVVVRYYRRGWRRGRRAVVCTHLVPGAWNGRHDRAEMLRSKRWGEHWQRLRETVAVLHAEGRRIVVMADTNRQGRFPDLHPDAVLATVRATDRIWAIPPKGRRVRVKKTGHVPLGIDFHHAIWAAISFPKE